MNLKERWYNLFEGIKYNTLSREYAFIKSQYSENDRTYHNIEHIKQCFTLLKEYNYQSSNLEIALFYHDVIYSPYNSSQSSKYASSIAAQEFLLTIDKDFLSSKRIDIHTIKKLIMTTKHPSNPITEEEKLIVDIDLSILGAENSVFEGY